jgi:hypothetical protein
MPTVDLFRQYAEQALRQAVQSKNEKEQLALIELMRTWTQAAEATSQGAACRGGGYGAARTRPT